MILNECSLGIEKEQLLKFYKDATKEKFNALVINLDTGNMNEKFSYNFNNFYKVESDSDSDSDEEKW